MAKVVTSNIAPVDLILDLVPLGRHLLARISGALARRKSTLAEGGASPSIRRVDAPKTCQWTASIGTTGYSMPSPCASETFGPPGFFNLIHRLQTEQDVSDPPFHRSQDQTGAGHVPRSCELVVVEGNYLLFDADPWRRSRRYGISVWLETDVATLRRRCMAGWLDHEVCFDDAAKKADGDDLRNATLIARARPAVDVAVTGASLDAGGTKSGRLLPGEVSYNQCTSLRRLGFKVPCGSADGRQLSVLPIHHPRLVA